MRSFVRGPPAVRWPAGGWATPAVVASGVMLAMAACGKQAPSSNPAVVPGVATPAAPPVPNPPREPRNRSTHPQPSDPPRRLRVSSHGMLTVQSSPWGRVFVDDVDTGRFSPVCRMTVPAGPHTIRVVNPVLPASRQVRVMVTAAQEARVVLALEATAVPVR